MKASSGSQRPATSPFSSFQAKDILPTPSFVSLVHGKAASLSILKVSALKYWVVYRDLGIPPAVTKVPRGEGQLTQLNQVISGPYPRAQSPSSHLKIPVLKMGSLEIERRGGHGRSFDLVSH